MRVKTTVYVPCHNYGRFLAEAIESVLAQTSRDWELIILGDGPVDDTAAIAKGYADRQADRIRYIEHSPAEGLQVCANKALEVARGDYILRLDADDYLDESALLVLSTLLDDNPEIALVYPNYTYVDVQGAFLGQEHRKKVGKETSMLDLPAHGACTMVRKRVLKSIGGYNESYGAQDGHELWLKVLHRYQVANVTTPLFFYRQHGGALSNDQERLLKARRQIKRDLVERQAGTVAPRVVAIIPAKNTYDNLPDIVAEPFAGQPLLEYTLAAAREVEGLDAIVVTTDSDGVIDYCDRRPEVLTVKRPMALSTAHVGISEVVDHAVRHLEAEHELFPDIVVLLSVHSPLRRAAHIRKALDNLLLYNADSVISVYEDYDLHFVHGDSGLEPLNEGMLRKIRLEREALYVDNGAIRVTWRDTVSASGFLGKKIGHTVMPVQESLQIKSLFDHWLIGMILDKRKAEGEGS